MDKRCKNFYQANDKGGWFTFFNGYRKSRRLAARVSIKTLSKTCTFGFCYAIGIAVKRSLCASNVEIARVNIFSFSSSILSLFLHLSLSLLSVSNVSFISFSLSLSCLVSFSFSFFVSSCSFIQFRSMYCYVWSGLTRATRPIGHRLANSHKSLSFSLYLTRCIFAYCRRRLFLHRDGR